MIKRVLALMSDAYGSRHGLAKFNRDLLQAMNTHPAIGDIVVVPRIILETVDHLPEKVHHVPAAAKGKAAYLYHCAEVLRASRDFDLVVCGHINLLPLAFPCSLVCRSPLLMILHGIDAWQPTGRRLTDLLVSRPDFLISVSSVTKERFSSWAPQGTRHHFVLPNCVDTHRFTPGPVSRSLVERFDLHQKDVLLTVSRLADQTNEKKGIDQVLEIMPRLLRQRPNLTYMVVGDGPDRGRLESKANQLGVSNSVRFAGYIAEEEKTDYYRLARAFVLPSRGEGFGIVLLEAMACGIPVVASKLDGGREAVREGALGVLVDPMDASDLESGILEALDRPCGVVPAGLEYFCSSKFQERAHVIFDAALGLRRDS